MKRNADNNIVTNYFFRRFDCSDNSTLLPSECLASVAEELLIIRDSINFANFAPGDSTKTEVINARMKDTAVTPKNCMVKSNV